MTTIIAKNRELVADRRKIITGRKTGNIGTRDEPKIYKTPYCLYGISGFEIKEHIPEISVPTLLLQQQLAVIFGMSYFVSGGKAVLDMLESQLNVPRKKLISFRKRIKTIRNIIGTQLGRELQKSCQGVLALGQFNTVHINDGQYLITPNNETLLIGSGTLAASILLDHNVPFEKLYPALRSFGIPTGATFDKLTVDDDLLDMFPPLSDWEFISTAVSNILLATKHEIEIGVLKPDQAELAMGSMARDIATLVTWGRRNPKTGKWIFAKNPEFDWDEPLPEKKKSLLTMIEKMFLINKEPNKEKGAP